MDLLRREPYRLFFPLGLIAGWIGVSHWFFYGFGYLESYSGLAHALALTQGMFLAFALGFLMTAVPRRTQTRPAHAAELAIGAAAVLITAIAAIRGAFIAAELAYGGGLVLLIVFAATRMIDRNAGRRPPNAFVMIPIGCAFGIAGAGMIARMINGTGSLEAYLVGRELVQQGVFLCFVIGVGSLVIPLIRGATPPADATRSGRHHLARAAYVAAGAVIALTFVYQEASPRLTLAVRALVVGVAVVASGAAGWPRKPGLHRRLVAVSVWLVPVGLAAAAVWPAHSVAALHVMFIGGLSLMLLAVSAHVSLGHANREALLNGRPLRAAALGVLVLAALALRVVAHGLPEHYYQVLGIASLLWLGGSLAWAALVLPALVRRPQ